MIKIGLTGGIGSGKSTVAHIFEILGTPVYYADNAAKRIMQDDLNLRSRIKEHFGDDIYAGGQLNRKLLAKKVFNNEEQLTILNSFVHPATIADAEQWMARQHTVYAIKEAALLFESGSDKQLDFIIGVSAPASLRIERVVQRDSLSAGEVMNRMQKQMDEELKMEKCDFIIYNDGHQMVIPQVLSLHEKFLAMG